MSRTKSSPATVGSGGIVTATGSLQNSLTKIASGVSYGANSQIAPPAQAGPAVGVVAALPSVTQRRTTGNIGKGTQR